MKKPKFSILLPTKNRLELLKSCINSVLEQNFNDFELIVSDNNSKDNTQKYCKSIFDSRLKYFRLNQDHPVTFNWNNAYSKARGEYIIIIGDDDYLTKNYLAKVNEQISNQAEEIIIVNQARYHHQDYEDLNFRNKLILRKYSNKTFKIKSSKYLSDFFNFIKTFHSASITIKKSISDTIIDSGEFGPYKEPFPDYTAIFRAISLVDHISYIDTPLLIAGVSSMGCGIQAQTNRKKYWNDEVSTKFSVTPPIPGDFFINYYYLSQKIVQSKIKTMFFEPNIQRYLELLIAEYFVIKFVNPDDSLKLEFNNIKQYSSTQPLKIQLKIMFLLYKGFIKFKLKKLGLNKLRLIVNKLNNYKVITASSITSASRML